MVANHLRRRDISDPRVLAAFATVPRDRFVLPAFADRSYDDTPLPIGAGQTISQPYVVAITAQALRLAGHERVLEIGTGSGYAAAILGMLAREVDTVERIEEAAARATAVLADLGITNVHVHHGDGTMGWPAGAPYEAIAVAAGRARSASCVARAAHDRLLARGPDLHRGEPAPRAHHADERDRVQRRGSRRRSLRAAARRAGLADPHGLATTPPRSRPASRPRSRA